MENKFTPHSNGGGLVESTAFVETTAYIGPNARVYGDAQVYGSAQVSVNARVYGDAQVYGSAQVSVNARVYGDAQVYGDTWEVSPLQIQGTRHFFTTASKTEVCIGCQVHTIDTWLEQFEIIGKDAGYTKDQIAEYKLYLDLAKSIMSKF